MRLTSKPLAVILLVFLFGGIAFSSLMGWWATESSRLPARFTEGEYAGSADPNDIRGSYTFGDIAASFAVTPEILAQAFGTTGTDPAAFPVKDLENLYGEEEFEIGTASVRLFVAFYTGLPFDLTDVEIYLPQSASDILLAQGNLTEEQLAYLEACTVQVDASNATIEEAGTTSAEETTSTTEEENPYSIKGRTTFGELISWGVPQEIIEGIIGAPLPNTAQTIRDYAAANGLDFSTIKLALQAEVDKVVP